MIIFEIEERIVNSRQRAKSLGYPIGYQGERIKNLLFHSDFQDRDPVKLRRASSCIPDFSLNRKQILLPRMARKEMNPPVIVVSSDETSLNRIRKIRKYRSMPQLLHGFSKSSQDSLFNKEERKRIKSVLLDIPDILQFDDSIALMENKMEPKRSPTTLHFSSQEGYQSGSIENDLSTASDLMKDLSKSASSYTEDIDDENHAMLVVAQKKKITSSYVEGKTPKPRIVFHDEINKWKEQGKSISDLPPDQQEGGPVESEILETEKKKEEKNTLPSHFLEQSSMHSMAENTSDEMYERLKPSPELEQDDWTSSDHWKYFAMRRKLELLQSCGDSQDDSRVEMLMTPEPCDLFHGKESPSFPKRFSDDFSRRATHSRRENTRGTFAVKGTLQSKSNLRNTNTPITDTDYDTVPEEGDEEDIPNTDGWKRLPLTPKSSKHFTEVNPDNNLRDALAAWTSLQNGNCSMEKEEESSTESQARRRSMTVGDVGIERQLYFDDLGEQHIKRKVSDVLVHLDKSFRLDTSLLDQHPTQSSISRGRQWLNKLLQHDFNRTASKTPTIFHNLQEPAPELTAEILPSSLVRQSLMNKNSLKNEGKDDEDDVVHIPIRISSKVDESRKEYLQNQTMKERRRKEELDKLRLSIAWDQISTEDPNEREKKFEQHRQMKDLAGMFGQEDDEEEDQHSKQASKMVRKTSSDKGALHSRFNGNVQYHEKTTDPPNTTDTRHKSRPKSQSVSKSTQKHSRKGSMNAFKMPNDHRPPLPNKTSMPRFEKGTDVSYTPPVTSDLLPTSQKGGGSRTMHSLINESLSDEPRSIASTSPEGEVIEPNQEVSLDSFLIEVDHTFFHLSDAKKNLTRPSNFSVPLSRRFSPSAAPSSYPLIMKETEINTQTRKDESEKQFKSSRRHSLSQMFKWKSNKVEERQTLHTKQPETITENIPPLPQKAGTPSWKSHQRSKSHRMQLFGRQKGDSST